MRFTLVSLLAGISVFAAIVGVLVWLTRLQAVTITDAEISRPRTYEIGIESERSVTGLTLLISGEIDGRATLTLEEYNGVHKVGPGKFEIDMSPHEYYSSRASVTYSPMNVSNGRIAIRYDFH